MGTIAEKLSYLADTKDLFRDKLNSLGAEITSSTTFRNYLTWLDTFYGEVSDKTDISQNGVVGRTNQNTAILPSEYTQVDYIESSGTQYIDTGVNADNNLRVVLDFAYTSALSANQNIGAIRLESGNNARYHILLGGSPTTNRTRVFVNDSGYYTIYDDTNRHLYDVNPSIGQVLVDNISYTIPSDIKDVGLNFWLFGRNSTSTIYLSKVKQWSCKMYYENELVRDFIPCYRNSDNEVGLYDIVNDVFYTNQGTGAFTYGSIVSIPNPDYPQPINNLSGDVPYKVSGKNLFDKNNYNSINAYLNTSGMIVSSLDTTIYIPCKSNTTYTISKTIPENYKRLRIGSCSSTPGINTTLDNFSGIKDNLGTYTITTSNDSNYLVFWCIDKSNTSEEKQQILDSIQIEKGSTATTYEPYISQTFNIPLKSKNLFDISKVERNVYYNYGTTGSVPTIATSDKRITLSPTNSIKVKPSTQYTLSFPSAFRYAIAEMENNYISLIDSGWKTNTTYTFTTSATTNYIGFNFSKTDNSTITDNDWNTFINSGIQLEENSTPTDYEPYYDIELCKIDTYEDKIYSSNGMFYLYKNINKVVLNGSESWTYASSSDGNRFVCGTYTDAKIPSSLNVIGALLSDKFIAESANDTTSSQNGIAIAASGKLVLYYDALKSYTTGGFTTWISNNNVIVYYALATPTTTEITQENYPSLYNALKQIQDYLTAYKINKEFILGYSSPEIEY